jgi:SAM-dependent methyltransferase
MADYYQTLIDGTTFTGRLWVHNDNKHGRKAIMPVETYFRNSEEMPELEWIALQQCRGRILDVGAGAGSHSLALQLLGQDVTALEISPLAASVIHARGVRQIICQDFFSLAIESRPPGSSPGHPDSPAGGSLTSAGHPGSPAGLYDTLLLMMNGIGLSGTLDGLRLFLHKAHLLLRPGGRLVFDSTDVAYLYDGRPPKTSPYYGEVRYQYEYRRERSDWFNWLFIDRKTLTDLAATEGWKTEVIFEDKSDQYLAACKRKIE